MIKMIAAVSVNGVIGLNNKLPWNYPADMRHFRNSTVNGTIVMGRKTFESVGCRPLPKRRNIVISSRTVDHPGVETFSSLEAALTASKDVAIAVGEVSAVPDVWLVGGAGIYQEGMDFAQEIHLTLVPDVVIGADAVRFPFINPRLFTAKPLQFVPGDEDQVLRYSIYERRGDV